jgi:hypothetical protein
MIIKMKAIKIIVANHTKNKYIKIVWKEEKMNNRSYNIQLTHKSV